MEIFMGKVSTPKPNGFADHYPEKKWLFHWEYSLFSDKLMYPIKMDQQSEQSGRILDYLSYVLCELYIVYQIFYIIYVWLVVWNIIFMTFHSVGKFIIPTDELIFFRGVAQPPTSIKMDDLGVPF